MEVDDVRWAFWRSRASSSQRPLPDDVGLPVGPRPNAASAVDDPDEAGDRPTGHRPDPSSGATPTVDPRPAVAVPLAAPGAHVERSALAAAGADVARVVAAPLSGPVPDDRTLAAAATGVLAARLPALSGVGAFDEPEDQLLHAYADLLVTRAQGRAGADREDLHAVAHLAAAAAALDAADDPALLLLADRPAGAQLRAAALLLAQTAVDGGGGADGLPAEVRALFGPRGS